LPFRKELFDTIISCEVIEHLQSPETFLTECNRLCNNCGTLILTTPNAFTLSKMIAIFLRLFKETRKFTISPLHVHEFNHFELTELLKKHDFYFLKLDFGALNPYYFPFCNNEDLSQKEKSITFIFYKLLNKLFSSHFLLELLFKWDFVIQAKKFPNLKKKT
jgi:SAM-dependent methyltransferase